MVSHSVKVNRFANVPKDWTDELSSQHRWKENGGMSMRERARTKIDEILSAEPRQILPPDVEKKIRTITERVVVDQTK